MSDDQFAEDYERSAGGLDHDEEEKKGSLADTLITGGPEALFQEIEDLVPERWKEHVQSFPLAAVALGFGVGVFLGAKKGNEILAAGSAMLSAAATANLNKILAHK